MKFFIFLIVILSCNILLANDQVPVSADCKIRSYIGNRNPNFFNRLDMSTDAKGNVTAKIFDINGDLTKSIAYRKNRLVVIQQDDEILRLTKGTDLLIFTMRKRGTYSYAKNNLMILSECEITYSEI